MEQNIKKHTWDNETPEEITAWVRKSDGLPADKVGQYTAHELLLIGVEAKRLRKLNLVSELSAFATMRALDVGDKDREVDSTRYETEVDDFLVRELSTLANRRASEPVDEATALDFARKANELDALLPPTEITWQVYKFKL